MAFPSPTQLNISTMVHKAIRDLDEPAGSSTQAIKKYIVRNYGVDMEKVAPYVNIYLKFAADEAGFLIRTSGRGATGSFTLPSLVSLHSNFNNADKERKIEMPTIPSKNLKTTTQPRVMEGSQTSLFKWNLCIQRNETRDETVMPPPSKAVKSSSKPSSSTSLATTRSASASASSAMRSTRTTLVIHETFESVQRASNAGKSSSKSAKK